MFDAALRALLARQLDGDALSGGLLLVRAERAAAVEVMALARRLRDVVRAEDLVAVLDEGAFAIVASATDRPGLAALAERLVARLRAAGSGPGGALGFGVGIAVARVDGGTPAALVAGAEAAAAAARTGGGHRWRFHGASDDADAPPSRAQILARDLRRALDAGQFTLRYQPQVDGDSGVAFGVEALLRWRHPLLGEVSPAEFVPIAERSGEIVPIGAWVLRTAAHQVARWRRDGGPRLALAVNVAAPQLAGGDLPGLVADVLAETGLPAEDLELELTERLLIDDAAAETIHRLGEMRVRLSIDDFGTGFSSLGYLKRFAIDAVKLDKSFVDGLPDDAHDCTLTRSIVRMAAELGLQIVAEGVETDAQRRYLLELGCHRMQGYHFARPLEADAIPRWRAPQSREAPAVA